MHLLYADSRIRKTTGAIVWASPLFAALAACSMSSDSGEPQGAPVVRAFVSPDGAMVNYAEACAGPPTPGTARCHVLARSDERGAVQAAITPNGLGAYDLQSAYALPGSGGGNQIVAIVDAFDNPNAEADLGAYRAQYGFAPCTTANGCFTKLNQNGARSPLPAGNSGWGLEIDLDLQMVSAACPNCKILLVEANSSNLSDLEASVRTAANNGAGFISNSYGGGEFSGEASVDSAFNYPGASIFASSGDGGYGVAYPAASAFVTAVGGTVLSRASNARGWAETAWVGAGSGCSAYVRKPSWQHDNACANRTVADVSAVAQNVAMYDSYGYGGWVTAGGTSVASPLVAATYAATGNNGADSSLSYYEPGAFFDITSGSNGSCGGSDLCTSGAGHDGPTGNGSPNGALLRRTNPSQDAKIAVLSRDSNTMEVFWITASGAVNDSYWYGDRWNTFELAPPGSASVGGHITAVSRNANTMEVWWIGADGSVQDAYFGVGGNWNRFTLAPAGSAAVNGSIAAVSRAANTMELWYIGADGSIQDRYFYDGGNWSGFALAAAGSASVNGSISVTSRNPSTMELWYIGADGSIQDNYFYDGGSWNGFQLAPAGSASTSGSISAAARTSTTIELWYIGADGSIQDEYFNDGGSWNGFELAPAGSARTSESVTSMSRLSNTVEVWFDGADGSIQDEFWYAGGNWGGFQLAAPGSAP